MKVIKSGILLIRPGESTVVKEWRVDSLDGHPDLNEGTGRNALIKAILLYVAENFDIDLTDNKGPEPILKNDLESERLTQEAISVARWGGDPTKWNPL